MKKEDCKKCAGTCQCVTVESSLAQNENFLIKLTKDALSDVLGREPTKKEILRAHAGFKRMAFIMFDHLEKTAKRS